MVGRFGQADQYISATPVKPLKVERMWVDGPEELIRFLPSKQRIVRRYLISE